MTVVYDNVIIGCGAIGVAVARALTLRRERCLIVDKHAQPLSEASSGNTGHMATFFQYPKEGRGAPLEWQLTRRAVELNREWLATQPNVPRRKDGCLYVAKSGADMDVLRGMVEIGKANGHGEELRMLDTTADVAELEPEMDTTGVVGGMLATEEYLVDSWLLPMSNLYTALAYGAALRASAAVEKVVYDKAAGVWDVAVTEQRGYDAPTTSIIKARRVINCGGNYSDVLNDHLLRAEGANDAKAARGAAYKAFSIRPGKGEYVYMRAEEGDKLVGPRHMVCGTPQPTTAGVYVYRSLSGHVVVGPTNHVQDSKVDRLCDGEHTRALYAHAKGLFPGLQEERVEGQWSGLRPAALPEKDYIIQFGKAAPWATVGGIRSTGLTASRAIAEYVAEQLPSLAGDGATAPRKDVVMPPPVLIGDGVRIGEHVFRPTHPLSKLYAETKMATGCASRSKL